MTTETAMRKFSCPKCGHKHAADLHAMEGHPEIHGKVPCSECHTLMWISLNNDGTATAELYEAHLHDVYEKKAEAAVQAATAAATAAPTTSGGSGGWIGPVLAAAVVAAVISLAMGAGGKGDEGGKTAKGSATPDPALQREVEALSAAVRTSESARADMAKTLVSLEAAVAQHGEALAQAAASRPDEGPKPEVTEMMKKVEAALARYAELNGRIEANYTNLRIALKRLDALEGK